MLKIKVLGTGCAGCLMMEQLIIQALQELGIRDAEVERVTEERMIEHGLLAERAPGLLVNGYLAWAGSIPDLYQVKEWLKQALVAAST